MRKYFVYILIIVGIFTLQMLLICLDGFFDDMQKVDVAVVLGNKVETDGMPSKRLQVRLDKAIKLYNQGYFDYIIVSGGLGKEGWREGDVMSEYLIQNGVPESNIIVDNDGIDTYSTARNTKGIMFENNFKSVLVITHYYHIARTKLAFRKFGLTNVYAAHSELDLELRDPYSIIRELAGYYVYLFKDYA